MVNYKPFHNALNGLSNKYERDFIKNISPALELPDPLSLSFDEIDGQNRSDLYRFLRDNFDGFQMPYAVAAAELGKAIYSSNRDLAELNSGKRFPVFEGVSLTEGLLKDNVIPFWEIAGLLKKVIEGDATLPWVSQIGSRGIVDLSRSITVAAGEADSKLEKVARVATQSGACKFCRQMAKHVEVVGDWKRADASFHSGCRCAIVFEYIL